MTITRSAHKNIDCSERCNTQTVFTRAYYTLSIYKYINYFNTPPKVYNLFPNWKYS